MFHLSLFDIIYLKNIIHSLLWKYEVWYVLWRIKLGGGGGEGDGMKGGRAVVIHKASVLMKVL
jgi:hypothetical protein